MLLSMTGYGDARSQDEQLGVAVEIRTVNNRYLKILMKCPDAYANLESRIEKIVRESVSRGTVNIAVRVDRPSGTSQYTVNRNVIETYWQQLNELVLSLNVSTTADFNQLLMLPGAISEEDFEVVDSELAWTIIQSALNKAIEKLTTFRLEEGRFMQQDLLLNCRKIAEQVDLVKVKAPEVVANYRTRMLERVRELLSETDVTVDSSDLIREVSIFSDRCDINEEITRLTSHLDQFETFLNDETSQGRKLEFLSQEMFREINTIGSKANNVAIAHAVVEMKGCIEKIRENLQNVE